jgi:hypothetical protein
MDPEARRRSNSACTKEWRSVGVSEDAGCVCGGAWRSGCECVEECEQGVR